MNKLSMLLLAGATFMASVHAKSTNPTLHEIKPSKTTKENLPLAELISQDLLSEKQLDAMRQNGRWLGPNWWANRLHDWKVKDGAFVCQPNSAFLGWRIAHDMTHVIKSNLKASVKLTLNSNKKKLKISKQSMAGFLIGAGHSLDNPLSKALIFDFHSRGKNWPAIPGSGIAVGINAEGLLRIVDLDTGKVLAQAQQKKGFSNKAQLTITTKGQGKQVQLIAAVSYAGKKDLVAQAKISSKRLRGGLALLSHPGKRAPKTASLETSFAKYKISKGCARNKKLAVGPIVATQYTVDRGTLKLSAQLMPQHKNTPVTLSILKKGQWQKVATQKVHPIDQMVLFRLENWDATQALPFRVSIKLDNVSKPATYTGRITAEPKKGNIRLAALGCIIHRPWGHVSNWNKLTYFPHHELQEQALAKKPDAVFFYGDQMYENTPSIVDRKNYHEDYLYKWLFHCVAFREMLRNNPSITIPDDHDVYQGNFWAEGGKKTNRDSKGGFVHPSAFVAQVHRTHTSHLPDAVAPNSMENDIPAYFCDWNWGGVSFAIIGDRLFKSGPAGKGLPSSGTRRPDHYNNPKFDTKDLDLPGLELLGKPQEDFLATWAADWSHGAKMKAMLSQSPLGNLATHHHGQYLIADLDSHGWPQAGRKRALSILRSARAVHVAGDQHLSTMVQHGIDNHNDAIFSFTAPAVSNAYARAYHPTFKGNYYRATPPSPSQYLGERLDGFKNKVTFHAVANPDSRKNGLYHTKKQPQLNHQVPGFGIVDFNTKKRTISFHSLPRSYEVAARLKGGEYPGWPITVKQEQNDGRKIIGQLIKVKATSTPKQDFPIVSVYGPDGQLQWSQRMNSFSFTVPAFAKGKHIIKINGQTFEATPSKSAKTIKISIK